MQSSDKGKSPDEQLTQGLAVIEQQHAQYRNELSLWVKDTVLARVNNIASSPDSHNSVFCNPDNITITIYLSAEDFLRFFNDRPDVPPIVQEDEIIMIVRDAIQQPGYTVEVLFQDWWPYGNDTWFTIQLKKPLGESTKNPSN